MALHLVLNALNRLHRFATSSKPAPITRNMPRPRRTRASATTSTPAPKTTRRGTSFGRVTKPRTTQSPAKPKALSIASKSQAPLQPPPLYKPRSPSPTRPSLPTSPISTQDEVEEIAALSSANSLSLAFEPAGAPVAREDEFNYLYSALNEALEPDNRACGMYISGTPGTGKTLTVSAVVKRLRLPSEPQDSTVLDIEQEEGSRPQTIWINCAHLGQPRNMYSAVASGLGLSSWSTANAQDVIRAFASTPGPRVVIVLDEVDFLSSRDQLVLYAAFEWPHIDSSRLNVVGIANSIDLPVRLLPWLRANSCMPDILPFAPYDSSALHKIVHERLTVEGKLSDVAIQLAAKKVAAGSGDARLVLDVCREAEMRVSGLGGGSAIAVVSSIIQARGGLSKAVGTIRQLPVQQQLALCVAANAVLQGDGKKNARKITLGGLYESFGRMCSRAKVACVSFNEFGDICCNALVSHGLLDAAEPKRRGKNTVRTLRSRLVRLKVPIEDVRAGVADRGFLPFLIAR